MNGIVADLLPYKGAAAGAVFVLLFLLERMWPATPAGPAWLGNWRRLLRNGGLFVLNSGLSLAVILPLTAWAASTGLWNRPAWWSGWTGLGLDLLLLDLWIYWWHRLNHVAPILWRFHQVHHLDRFLDTSSAVRFHFGEVLLSALLRAGVILALGIPFATVVVFETLVLSVALFHHSNLALPRWLERPLSYLIITPSIHWVHHHAIRADTDSNYGSILSLWDRLFGSRSRTTRTPDMEIGLEGGKERDLPGLLGLPFGRTAASSDG